MTVALVILIVLLVVAVAAAWALLVQFAAQQGRILMRLEALEERLGTGGDPGICGGGAQEAPEELPVGAPFPVFDQIRGRRAVVVNWSLDCGFCEAIAGDLDKLRAPLSERGTELVLLTSGGADAFGGIGTPAAYLVDEEGRVASPRALGTEEVLALARESAGRTRGLRVRSLRESRIRRDGLPPGSRAPDFTLRAVNDGEVSLRAYRGRSVLLVFSDPHCPPCDELAPQLAELHREGRAGLAIVMVGRGDPDENRRKCDEHGLGFPVVVQRGSRLSKAYGIFSWPVAFLVDEDGLIAENVAIGIDAILALARRGARAGEEAPMRV